MQYAWEISKDKNFVYLLEAENGKAWDHQRRSILIGKNGYYDYGMCQINKGYHKKIVNDDRFFTDWKWQMNQCLRLYKGGTTFYGVANIWETKTHFEWR